jgi:uncharacterized membrane protein YhaH (DUF805 family)
METLKSIFFNFKNNYFFNRKGTATRKEFWLWILASFVISFILTSIDQYFNFGLFIYLEQPDSTEIIEIFILSYSSSIFSLLTLPYLFSIIYRRFHDAGWSPWWFALPFFNFYILVSKTKTKENKYLN